MKELTRAEEQIMHVLWEIEKGVVNDILEVPITPKKTDIFVSLFGVAWMPYYLSEAGGKTVELPAFAIG